MAATLLSPENKRELALLRARAFGPDADIALDQAAIARLIELEGWGRPDAEPTASARPLTTAPLVEPTTQLEATASPPSKLSWPRVPFSAVLLAAAVIGLGIGLPLPGLLPPHPDSLLQAVAAEGAAPSFTSYGVVDGAPTHYEMFHDLEVWSARMADGADCVLVISADRSWRTGGCAPAPLDPMAEVLPYPVIRTIEGLDLPTGSVVRFILRGDAVQVWIDESAEAN